MVVTLGDQVAFVGMPGEIFCELGLTVKNLSPYRYTFLNELANGQIGYVPDRKALQEGSYGAAPGSTRCAPRRRRSPRRLRRPAALAHRRDQSDAVTPEETH
jgi:hypothetical protein